jgi:hypothetical protein
VVASQKSEVRAYDQLMSKVGIFVVFLVFAPALYFAIFGAFKRGWTSERDMSPFGDPEGDRVPGSRRRF